ncbi:MAG: glycosyltransferase family 4 protein [Huintestinicola sp.]
MNKPKLLYASPFPPMKSGISDYSVILVNALKRNFDITLFIEDYEITDAAVSGFPVLRYKKDNIDFDSFDYILYNMGNNSDFHSYIYETALEHPGIIIQHDLVLFHFIWGYYKEQKRTLFTSLYKNFSIEEFVSYKEAFKNHKINIELASKLPLNTELIRSENRFITHSEYTKNKILESGLVDKNDITHINHITLMNGSDCFEESISKKALYSKYNVPTDAVVICAFGYIQNTKLNRETCHAIKKLAAKSDQKICYVMVGKGDYVNDELEDGLIIKTGFTELDEFNSFIQYADIIVNLRNPTMGETSGAMLRILQLGKVCITNNGGWFSELPDDCVCKIELDNTEKNLEAALGELISDKERCSKMSVAAKKYVEENCSAEIVCKQMTKFIIGNSRKNKKLRGR